jgi:hypothetical protein
MGEIRPFTPEKLIAGVLISRSEFLPEVEGKLQVEFGPMDYRSGLFPFTFTDYYDREMGEEIFRCFFSFKELVDPAELAAIKLRCNELEQLFLEEGRRKVNLDPGLLSLGKLILASTKDNAQRVPLSRGIYGEISLIYRKKAFRPLPWTYPDYQSDRYHEILRHIRGLYAEQLRG